MPHHCALASTAAFRYVVEMGPFKRLKSVVLASPRGLLGWRQ